MADLDLQDEEKQEKKLSVADVMDNEDAFKSEVHEEMPKSQSQPSAKNNEAVSNLDVVMSEDKGDAEVIEDVPVAKPQQELKSLSQTSYHKKNKKVVIHQTQENDNLNGLTDIPQEAFMPNSRYASKDIVGDVVYLHWSHIGIISLRKAQNFTSIDVEFSDKNFHRSICINDDFESSMASLNYTGMVLASKAEEIDLDQYEDDDE